MSKKTKEYGKVKQPFRKGKKNYVVGEEIHDWPRSELEAYVGTGQVQIRKKEVGE